MQRFQPILISVAFSLLGFSLEAADEGADLRRWVIEGVAAGTQPRVFIDLMGRPSRAKILAADDRGVQVSVGGLEARVPWDQISARRLFSIARNFAARQPAQEQTKLVAFGRAHGLVEQADAEAARILALDASLKEKLFPPAPKAVPGAGPKAPAPPRIAQNATPGRRPPASIGKYAAVSASMISSEHPRLFFRKKAFKDVPSRAQALALARSGFRARFTGKLRKNNPAHQALEFLLSGDKSAATRAIGLMKKKGPGGWYRAGGWTIRSSLAYDWLYDYPGFTDADKAQAEAAILYGLKECLHAVDKDVHYIWNGFWIGMGGAMCAGIALHGHRQEATSAMNTILRRFDEGLLALDHMDGAWTEGPSYAVHSLHYMMPAAQAFWSATGKSPYRRHPGLARFAQWFLWMTRPDWTLDRWDDSVGGSNINSNQVYAAYMLVFASGTSDPVTAWYAKRLVEKWGPKAYWLDDDALYLALLPRPEKTHPIARPPERLSDVFGRTTGGFVIARSGWRDTDALLVFRCGQNVSPGHQHYCANAFTFYHGAPLAIDSGQYNKTNSPHNKNYAKASVAHNVVNFPLAGQPKDDGGQQQKFRHTLNRAGELLNPGGWGVGRIIGYEEKGAYVYMAGDASRAYGGACSYYVREIVYLRPNQVVILDRFRAGAGRRPTWLLHAVNEPAVQGTTFTIENKGARLSGAFVIPKPVQIEKIGGPGKEFWNRGKNWSTVKPSTYHEPGAWRIEAHAPGGGNMFLVVLQSGGGALSVQPADEGSHIGVRFSGRTVLFRRSAPGGVTVR